MSLERAHAELARVPVAVQGQQGRRALLRAAYVGHDWGIPPDEWAHELAAWNARNQPPWGPAQLESEVVSMYRSARKNYGWKTGRASSAPPSADGRPLPPREDMRAVWGSSVPVSESPHVGEYLTAQGLDAAALAALDNAAGARGVPVVRALETGANPGPTWCADWPRRGYRLLTPLFDIAGKPRSLIGRNIMHPSRWKAGDEKTRFPPGRMAGLFFASPHAVESLRGEMPASRWRRWVLLEGDKDALATMARYAGDGVAVLGMPGAAGLPAELLAWLRSSAGDVPVVVAMDKDKAGQAYAAKIIPQLKGCRVEVPI